MNPASTGVIGFAHTDNIFGRAIRFAERRDGEEGYWNHVFASRDGELDSPVIQAEIHGVTDDKPLNTVGEYTLVALPETADPDRFFSFLDAQVGDHYGFLSITSDAFGLYLPEDVCYRQAGTWVCSGLIAGALWYAGWPPAMCIPDLYSVRPSWLAKKLAANVPGSH